MSDCADLQAFVLTEGEAALLLDETLRCIGTFEAACIPDRSDCAPLPSGMLSCGEAMRLLPALAIMLVQAYPRLVEPEMFAQALQLVALEYVTGEPS